MKRSLAVLALAVTVAGCGGSGSASPPASLPPVSPTPAGAATPTTSAPVTSGPATTPAATPVAADPESLRASAGDFARRWVETLNAAYGTLETAELAALSSPDCQTCQGYISGMSASKAVGQQWVGGLRRVLNVDAAPVEGGRTDVLVRYDADDFYVLESSGARSNDQAARTGATYELSLDRRFDSWIVAEVVRL